MPSAIPKQCYPPPVGAAPFRVCLIYPTLWDEGFSYLRTRTLSYGMNKIIPRLEFVWLDCGVCATTWRFFPRPLFGFSIPLHYSTSFLFWLIPFDDFYAWRCLYGTLQESGNQQDGSSRGLTELRSDPPSLPCNGPLTLRDVRYDGL